MRRGFFFLGLLDSLNCHFFLPFYLAILDSFITCLIFCLVFLFRFCLTLTIFAFFLSGHVFMFWDSCLKLSRAVSCSNCMVGMQSGTIVENFGLWCQMRWSSTRTYSSSNNSSNPSSICPQRPAPLAWTLSPPALDITARVTPLSLVSAAPIHSSMTNSPMTKTVVKVFLTTF